MPLRMYIPNRAPIIVHVNRSIIAFNAKHGVNLPIYTLKIGRKIVYARSVRFLGVSELIDPEQHKPLSCGARAWVETHDAVSLKEEFTWKEVQAMKKAVIDAQHYSFS